MSLISGDKLPQIKTHLIPHFDKMVHFGFYFGLTILLIHDIVNYKQWYTKRLLIAFLAVTASIFFGGTIELLQHIQSLHRTRDFYDFLANTFGAVMGVFMFRYFSPLLLKAERIFIKS
jgi:VanZ family protein